MIFKEEDRPINFRVSTVTLKEQIVQLYICFNLSPYVMSFLLFNIIKGDTLIPISLENRP